MNFQYEKVGVGGGGDPYFYKKYTTVIMFSRPGSSHFNSLTEGSVAAFTSSEKVCDHSKLLHEGDAAALLLRRVKSE